MSQSSTIVLDGTGEEVLAAINAAMATVRSHTSGSSAPSDPVAYMFWADTSTGKMKQRNAANTAWIERWDLGEGGLSATVTQEVFSLPGSFTWTKPTKGTIARVQLWGGGAAGQTNYNKSGGGGGGYNEKWILLSALAGSVAVIVGAGGASSGAGGGLSQFGNSPVHLIAYGGASSTNTTPVSHGGGPFAGKLHTGYNLFEGSQGFVEVIPGTEPPQYRVYHSSGGNWFGGGGGHEQSGLFSDAGNSIWGGGGGGAGNAAKPGGTSVHGGAGGAGGSGQYGAGSPGQAPGGGGGGSMNGSAGAGAAGRAIITVF